MVVLLWILAAALLALNAFFVLAEFAVVRVRPTRVEELVAEGRRGAKLVRDVQRHLDEYLSVCQVGITLASIGLGFVGEPAVARLIEPILGRVGVVSPAILHGLAFGIAYGVIVYLHVVAGELVPKTIAIRFGERAALLVAPALIVFRALFWLPMVVLNGSANAIVRGLGLAAPTADAPHTDRELRIIVARAHARGLFSFRRLLMLENIFDLRDRRVRDVMRPRDRVRTVDVSATLADLRRTIAESRFSRYPLLAADGQAPLGVIHVKDLWLAGPAVGELPKLARPFVRTSGETGVEALLAELQRRHTHVALVFDAAGRWTGLVTLEDLIEEIIGAVEDEFSPRPVSLLGTLSADRITTTLAAGTLADAVARMLANVPAGELPLAPSALATTVGLRLVEGAPAPEGLAVLHGRLPAGARPIVALARAPEGVPVGPGDARAHVLLLILTPADGAGVEQGLLIRADALAGSGFTVERLRQATDAAAVLDAVREGEAAATR